MYDPSPQEKTSTCNTRHRLRLDDAVHLALLRFQQYVDHLQYQEVVSSKELDILEVLFDRAAQKIKVDISLLRAQELDLDGSERLQINDQNGYNYPPLEATWKEEQKKH